MVDLLAQANLAKSASKRLALLSTEAKNEMLILITKSLKKNTPDILRANKEDLKFGKKRGLSKGLLDRIELSENRLSAIISDLLNVVELKDYVGDIIEDRTLPNGLQLQRVRVPIGVVGIIYEARPNVTVDCTALCLKSGNAVMLKGGSDALHSNRAIVKAIKSALPDPNVVQFIDSTDRKTTGEFLNLKNLLDVVIPRGGRGLIDFVKEHATVPVIETGASVVHIFVDEFADIEKSVKVVMNAKLRRTAICNTLDTLLLHEKIAADFLERFVSMLLSQNRALEFHADPFSLKILKSIKIPKKNNLTFIKAGSGDYDIEFLSEILAVKIVKSLDSALSHIAQHSLKHSEAILTEKTEHAERFLREVDAACVYVNASTQFSDGAQFGLGAEIGISTQKLHVRGPFALEGLTSYKWVIRGDYQVRPS